MIVLPSRNNQSRSTRGNTEDNLEKYDQKKTKFFQRLGQLQKNLKPL